MNLLVLESSARRIRKYFPVCSDLICHNMEIVETDQISLMITVFLE